MLKLNRAAMVTLTGALALALIAVGTTVFPVTQASAAHHRLSSSKAYTFAGVIADRSRRVKRNKTTAEVKVTEDLPEGKNMGKAYDVIFVVRPSTVASGKILTLTSGPVAQCRGFLKTFLSKTLSPKRIKKAYKDTKLATTDKDAAAKSLAEGLQKNGWLNNCSTEPMGEVDAFQILIVNDRDR